MQNTVTNIDYKFNTWRISGEKAEGYSKMTYRLLNKNLQSDNLTGYKIGHILYLHHLKGMTAQDIKKHPVGYGSSVPTIKSVIKGFGRLSGVESLEAYEIAMYMIEHEPEELERLYSLKVTKGKSN